MNFADKNNNRVSKHNDAKIITSKVTPLLDKIRVDNVSKFHSPRMF